MCNNGIAIVVGSALCLGLLSFMTAAAELVPVQLVRINIRATNRPIAELLQEIQRQTGYRVVIDVDNETQQLELARKVSVMLRDYPLSDGLYRLMKGQNCSLLFDEDKHQIRVLILGEKSRVNQSLSVAKEGDRTITAMTESEEGASIALMEYRAGKRDDSLDAEKADASMQGMSQALTQYQSGQMSEQVEDLLPAKSMEKFHYALAAYRDNQHQNTDMSALQPAVGMINMSKALVKYKKGLVAKLDDAVQPAGADMQAMSAALREYKQVRKRE